MTDYPSVDDKPLGSVEMWKKQLYEGCLLGGAVGDALGYPVEFASETEIQDRFGDAGICQLSQAGNPARVSDDTQMTLFAANAIFFNACHRDGMPLPVCLKKAYQEWFNTHFSVRMENQAALMWVY